MNVLFLGDIVGKVGRRAVCRLLPSLIHRESVAFVIANVENATSGTGVKPQHARDLLAAGVDVLTSGNHIWRHKEIVDFISSEPRLLRPDNYPPGTPGRGCLQTVTAGGEAIVVLNLIGRVFMDSVDCPFQAAERNLEEIASAARMIFVDMHAEASSEKGAMGWMLDGRVTAVLGTHTHVQTADERILPGGTAFLSDAGMCGPVDSVIGVKHAQAIYRFRTHLPIRFEPANGRAIVQGAVVTVDPRNGKATGIRRVQETVD